MIENNDIDPDFDSLSEDFEYCDHCPHMSYDYPCCYCGAILEEADEQQENSS